MRKQYQWYETSSWLYRIILYHDGIQVDETKKWYGDELNEYLIDIEEQGYTEGYTQEEVDEAKARFEYLRDNLIEGV